MRVCTSAHGRHSAFLDRGPHRRGLLFIFPLIEMECCRGQGTLSSPFLSPQGVPRTSSAPPRFRARNQVRINLTDV